MYAMSQNAFPIAHSISHFHSAIGNVYITKEISGCGYRDFGGSDGKELLYMHDSD